MHRFMYVVFIFIAFCAHARTLHVGDSTIKLSQTKTTTPALHIKVDGEIWYGNMGRCQLPMNENTDKELKIKYNDKEYWVSEIEPTKDYVIVDGKLIAANCNIYLESTGTQWIDTGFIPNRDTVLKTDYQFLSMTSFRGYNEVQTGCGSANNSTRFVIAITNQKWHFAIGVANITPVQADLERHTFRLNAPNKLAWLDNASYDVNYETFQSDFSFGLFTRNDSTSLWPFRHTARSFNTKIWDNDVLVRHFVPVPQGLQIGDFVVPSNGMWDIIEQKFYGNMGSGDFIYGVDE